MNRQLLLLAVIAAVYSVAEGLKCKSCMFMEAHSDNSFFDQFLPKANDTSCWDSVDEVEEQDCSFEGMSGMKFLCGTARMTGTGTQDVGDDTLTVTYTMLMRDCLPVTTEDRFSIGCHDISEFPEAMENVPQDEEGIDITYEGQMCFCDGDNCNNAPGEDKCDGDNCNNTPSEDKCDGGNCNITPSEDKCDGENCNSAHGSHKAVSISVFVFSALHFVLM